MTKKNRSSLVELCQQHRWVPVRWLACHDYKRTVDLAGGAPLVSHIGALPTVVFWWKFPPQPWSLWDSGVDRWCTRCWQAAVWSGCMIWLKHHTQRYLLGLIIPSTDYWVARITSSEGMSVVQRLCIVAKHCGLMVHEPQATITRGIASLDDHLRIIFLTRKNQNP